MISIIIITYNNYDELLATYDSATRVTVPHEIIIINGGQCPQTNIFLQNQKESLKYISEPDNGISEAFNKGIKLAKYKYITFLNSGDLLIEPSYYEAAVEQLEKDPNTNFSSANILFNDYEYDTFRMKPRLINLGRGMPHFHQTMIFKRELFSKYGDFDESFKIAMDYEFMCRLEKEDANTGHYFKNFTPIHMDGGGISRKKELSSIVECIMALSKSNFLLQKNIITGLSTRFCYFLIRKAIKAFCGKNFLHYLKRKKYC